MSLKVVLTGGGTGGHIYPALAVAEAARRLRLEAEIRYVGGRTGMEAEIVPPTGLPFVGLTTKKLHRLLSPGTVGVLLALWKGYREALAFLRSFRPDVVIGTGGYVAAAAALAAQRLRVPTVILAPDAIPGRTNRLLARRAARICVMFEETRTAFPSGTTALTGLPIRADIVSPQSKEEARQTFGLKPGVFTVLVTGGSQGAQRLNEIVADMLNLPVPAIQILHQTGPRNYETMVERARRQEGEGAVSYFPCAYFDSEKMPLAYRAADILVCRSGVSTLAELTANGLPALMVPLPTAYADHQTYNARAIERGGGGIVLPQAALTPESLAQQIEALRDEPARRAQMAEASKALGRPDAADRVVEIALDTQHSTLNTQP
jgi:UDP-N-acetylglucosamine--N-acetylmuramyl-(pentapeptide) pyrophosphoryl-undecaprenol N-acetylglucosamine transferase